MDLPLFVPLKMRPFEGGTMNSLRRTFIFGDDIDEPGALAWVLVWVFIMVMIVVEAVQDLYAYLRGGWLVYIWWPAIEVKDPALEETFAHFVEEENEVREYRRRHHGMFISSEEAEILFGSHTLDRVSGHF